MAHAALPGLLPTPPELKTMVPLLPTPPPCAAAIIIVPKQSPPNNKPGRADAVDRWDAGKNDVFDKSPAKPIGRADSEERWDARKITAMAISVPAASSSSSSGSSGGCQSSSDRKKSSSASSSCARWDSNKKKTASKRPVSRGSSLSSAERWDAHKKPRAPLANDGESSTGSNDMMEVDDAKPKQLMTGLYAAPGFLAGPEPSMLPTPSFQLVLPRFVSA
ncbi:hypothetical protein PR202_gb16393 [Eleusine coracana subsp. coracana]|uniref:Uncharacterized protein n=1 Tax=Eleusine coracana subsp. coracana TaxID=191504 RepID=A0AAV5F0C3_ELECO|nr:hypothetical protein QOZ80_9BG0698790 [Eleusine coracana subsp. coracana]GJN28286.1 hypothetical protein PR202_gb16393 [Eleusine coracana subsp. coracana]